MLETSVEKGINLLLKTIDADEDQAVQRYLALRERLERFFEWRGMENVEGLTDIVFDRVINKIEDGEKIKNVEAFCVSVAKYVLLEGRRKSLKHKELDENSTDLSADTQGDYLTEEDKLKDKRLSCLDKCLAELPEDKRKLLLQYFNTDEKTMIAIRKRLAENTGVNLNTLRIRISRLKTKLEKCTKKCCENR